MNVTMHQITDVITFPLVKRNNEYMVPLRIVTTGPDQYGVLPVSMIPPLIAALAQQAVRASELAPAQPLAPPVTQEAVIPARAVTHPTSKDLPAGLSLIALDLGVTRLLFSVPQPQAPGPAH